MSIQWYPGHMRKAREAIAASMPGQDLVIEVLDARMPRASENPVVAELRGRKPCLKVLSKSDLADPEVTRDWLSHFALPNAGGGRIMAIATSTTRGADARADVAAACNTLASPSRGRKTARAMVVGIPNVGKSTLVNTLSGRRVANVRDEPAVTKAEQVVVLPNGIALTDNPGILWPKIDDASAGLRLAFAGAIPDSSLDYERVALFGARVLLERYPARLTARYGIVTLPRDAESLLVEIGRRRGCLRAGGIIDVHKAAGVLIHDFRAGVIGRISLERPEGE